MLPSKECALKLICSAFKGKDAHTDAVRTADLIRFLDQRGLLCEVAIGVFQNAREVSIIATGFLSDYDLRDEAHKVCIAFEQECVYYSTLGQGFLLKRSGDTVPLGLELQAQHVSELGVLFKEAPASYTERLNYKAVVTAPTTGNTIKISGTLKGNNKNVFYR